ncbi:MAG: thiamine-phosphate kinase [Oligoflexia bacterium]|nr:thiamine-phosphate kinase [Oligoflexia bacterium]MBF0365967.1 thiamine-phosphate kinase [Oligoflexia bacterium]
MPAMRISELGGEFALIERVSPKGLRQSKWARGVLKGIGDDCAILKLDRERAQVITTDMMVENDHFSLLWQTPSDVGFKLGESSISDIFAMAATPKYAFISMSIKSETTVEFIDEFYKGLYQSFTRHGVLLLGGDTTHGTEYVFSLTVIGEAKIKDIRRRDGAKVGDRICVTGKLGESTAGLKYLLKHKREGRVAEIVEHKEQLKRLRKHLRPHCRVLGEAIKIGRFATAMIDVSDGLAPEVKHIAKASAVGARIFLRSVPLSKTTQEIAKELEHDAYDYALYGGEDYELVFTIAEADLAKLKKLNFKDFKVVGEVVAKKLGVMIRDEMKNEEYAPKKGYDHFGV